MSNLKCSICGQTYETGNIKILGHRDDFWFLGAFCSSCRSHSLIAAIIKKERSPQAIVDLTDKELDKFSQCQVIGNDMLDIHNFLKDFDGDFARLFAEENNQKNKSL